MNTLQWFTGLISAAFIVVGFAMLGQASLKIYRIVRLGQPDPTRGGPVVARSKTLVKEFLGHTRML
jgi:hypothetical protein